MHALKAKQAQQAANCLLRRIPLVTWNDVLRKKSSDTLFVLGSGSSVMEYSTSHWDHIRRHDSLGFNFWTLHPFTPTFYVNELYGNKSPEKKANIAIVLRNLALVSNRYRDVLQMTKTPLPLQYGSEVKRLGLKAVVSQYLRARSLGELESLLADCLRQPRGRIPIIFHRAATVDWAVSFARVLGYKALVLCGVDLSHSHYFFEDPRYSPLEHSLQIPENMRTGVHKTADSNIKGDMTVQSVLNLYQEQPPGLGVPDIFVAAPSSLLHPRLEVYLWPPGLSR